MGIAFPRRVELMGVPIDPFTMEQTVQKTEELIQQGLFAHLIGVNADKLLQMIDDPTMDQIVRSCEIINADGASMVMAAEKLDVPVPERVAGIDFMYELCQRAALKHYKVFLFGAKQEVVEKTKEVLESLYPEIQIVGTRNGYFSDTEVDSIADEIKKSEAVITFVGITSPKKEHIIEYFREYGLTGVFVGVGGSFDVVSGNIPRAPKWMQKAKLEWLYRMMQEPKRLFKHYLVGNMRFIKLLQAEIKKQERRA